nr:reverse transcriptase domain-containing protein [Tanacetum cinerariifolium]
MQKQSPSGSGSLPSNTVANLRGDLKAITTQSSVAYDGPTIPPTPSPLSKEVERETKATKDKAITFKVGRTSRYYCNYYEEFVNQIDVIDVSCEEYAQEVLGFLDSFTSGNPTPSDPIIASSTPSFTPFEGSDFILEEIETFLHTPDELSSLDDDFDPEGDIALIEKLLNKDPSLNLPAMKNEDLKQADVTIVEPLELELNELRAVLGQRKIKHFQPIHYASKTMMDAQACYTTMEKELLAVVYAFKKFQPYLVLSKTIVYTDHSALKYLLAKQDAKSRLLWWILLLQEFDVII